jgi:hypothetical protein
VTASSAGSGCGRITLTGASSAWNRFLEGGSETVPGGDNQRNVVQIW